MTGVEFRNRSPYRARSMGRTGFGWSPPLLGLRSWYDVQAGGTSTTIADKSGNGLADGAYGATTTAPQYLAYTGVPYVHLEAATAGTNSISCTAPANTASYSAAPLGGGAATTGAAAAGAFAFTTAGNWETIELLDAGAVVLARFIAADCSQTGVTDSFAVVWTINRGTGGRKTVVFGPTANSTRSVALLDTTDLIVLPTTAMPAVTASAPSTLFAAVRQWATAVSTGTFLGYRSSGGGTPLIQLRMSSGTAMNALAQNGVVTATSSVTITPGATRLVAFVVFDGTNMTLHVNSSSGTPSATSAGDFTVSSNPTFKIGVVPSSLGQEFSLMGMGTADRALSSTERALVTAYYGGGS